MNDLLFNLIAITATTGFVLGVMSGWLPLLALSLILAGLLYWLVKKLP